MLERDEQDTNKTPDTTRRDDPAAHIDPLSGERGAHPLGVGIGAAAAGLAAGAAAGTVAGPAGAAIGAALGAIAGGLVGKDVAELADPTTGGAWWRAHYAAREDVKPGTSFADYEPAYYYGVALYLDAPDLLFDPRQAEMAEGWDRVRGDSGLVWEDALPATRDAWIEARRRTAGQ
jgi:hypothetical protein